MSLFEREVMTLKRMIEERDAEIARLNRESTEFQEKTVEVEIKLHEEIARLTSIINWQKLAIENREAENSRLRDALDEYGAHDRDCILSFWEAGEPTSNGGYRRKIKGQWYQYSPVDESPKCNCGFQEALASPPKEEKPI